jgi:beta-glucosidase
MTDTTALAFPPGFGWGTATAAFQIEGAAREGGRGPSIWDTFAALPGRIADGSSGDIACDHYHRWDDDLDLLAWLGAPYYRFSPSWSRLQPAGRGALNQTGLDFYSRLIDGLLERGITPWMTLYHWDLPQPLQDSGGWPNRSTASAFADYAAAVHARLGDRVRHWTTLNEPWCAAFLGHAHGIHAPGIRDPQAAVAAAHHLLLGHGLAVQALRADGCRQVGITLNLFPTYPSTQEPADIEVAARIDGLVNRIFLDPVLRGRYPADVLSHLRRHANLDAVIGPDDLAVIAAPLDMLGINYYTRFVVRKRTEEEVARKGARPVPWIGSPDVQFTDGGLPRTEMGWEVFPDGLEQTLRRISTEYPPLPLWITESGSAFGDVLAADGTVDDKPRVSYLHSHFQAAQRALESGVDLRGYFVWSLLDNFEWAMGYAKRFGLFYVDYPSQRRIAKRSARWFRQIVAATGASAASAPARTEAP